MNTPVRLPRSVRASVPIRSIASQTTSSISRCCGSMVSASRGVIPKNPASKEATSVRKPPSNLCPPAVRSGQPRSVGMAEMASRSSSSSCHSSSGVSTPPG